MVSLSLAFGLSDSTDGFPPVMLGVLSGSLPAPLRLGGELNSLLELLSLCSEEPTSPQEVLNSLGILSLVLTLGGWGKGLWVWRGHFLTAQWPVFSGVFLATLWPWYFPFGNSFVVAPWPWWFLSHRSPLAVSWLGQFLLVVLLVTVPSCRAFSHLCSAFGWRIFSCRRMPSWLVDNVFDVAPYGNLDSIHSFSSVLLGF